MKRTTITFAFIFLFIHSRADYWTQKANFPGPGRELPFSFVIGSLGYVGCGRGVSSSFNDFWEYDPISNVWLQKANFAGAARCAAVGFSINGKGYAGTGLPQTNDFWEYDPVLDQWTQKANVGGSTRCFASGFSINNKGYIGCGHTPYVNDFWEYDPVTDTWTQKADCGNIPRSAGVGISTSNKGYIGTGQPGYLSDFWEYDPALNTWTQKADVPGGVRKDATGFSICDMVYVGTAEAPHANDFWQYDPAANSWIQKTHVPGNRDDAIAFAIRNKGYLGLGQDSSGFRPVDLWEYTPDNDCETQVDEFAANHKFQIAPNPATEFISIKSDLAGDIKCLISVYNSAGKLCIKRKGYDSDSRIDINELSTGVYIVEIITGVNRAVLKFVKE